MKIPVLINQIISKEQYYGHATSPIIVEDAQSRLKVNVNDFVLVYAPSGLVLYKVTKKDNIDGLVSVHLEKPYDYNKPE